MHVPKVDQDNAVPKVDQDNAVPKVDQDNAVPKVDQNNAVPKVDQNNACGNRILKAYANSLDPDETPQNVATLGINGLSPVFQERGVMFHGEDELVLVRKKALANSVDPDETPHHAATDKPKSSTRFSQKDRKGTGFTFIITAYSDVTSIFLSVY
ncbi:hypothetical protein DPMN_012704 [Dreissena polymorpha]|uniref:Uncharacterized protein n=1 Tax=Dreissena polymorpha TaxID=45954 RepID=A0A9D4N3X8_DREPO|nr:hypothetical protein DPMN_012704 [Dreissena polymorpha]